MYNELMAKSNGKNGGNGKNGKNGKKNGGNGKKPENGNGNGHVDAPSEVPENPWDQQPDEPIMWYDRFLAYRDMGSARSLFDGYTLWLRQAGKYEQADTVRCRPGSWAVKSQEFAWIDRAHAWDLNQRKKRQISREQQLIDLQEIELRLAYKLFDQAEKMNDWPMSEKTVQDDGQTIIFKPAGWSKSIVGKNFKDASEMARRALEAPLHLSASMAGPDQASDSTNSDDQQRDFEEMKWLVEAMPERKALSKA